MNYTTNVESGHDLFLKKTKTVKSIQRHAKNMNLGGQFFCFGNRSTPVKNSDIIRWAVEVRDRIDKNIGNILLSSIANSENAQPGSGVVCLMVALKLTELFTKQGSRSVSQSDVNQVLRSVLEYSYRPSSLEVLDHMDSISSGDIAWQIFKKSIDLAGSSGNIQVFDSNVRDTIIKKVQGYRFDVQVPEIFNSSAGITSKVRYSNPKVVCIDGLIERMSEINGIVHESYAENIPLVIIARGFDNDVCHTLGVNYSTGNLSIIPYVARYDELGANTLKDICAVTGGTVTSSLTGDLISTIEWDNIPSVDSIVAQSNSMAIDNCELKLRISNYRKEIYKKKLATSDPTLKSNFDLRLASLGGHSVQVFLGSGSKDMRGIIRDRIDHHIRYYREACSKGLVNLGEAHTNIKMQDRYLTQLLEDIKNHHNKISVASLVKGMRSGLECANSISSLGASISIDR